MKKSIKLNKTNLKSKWIKFDELDMFKKKDIDTNDKEAIRKELDLSNIDPVTWEKIRWTDYKKHYWHYWQWFETKATKQEKFNRFQQSKINNSVVSNFQNQAMIQLAKYKLAQTDFKTFVLLMTTPAATWKDERTLFFTNSTIHQIESYQKLWNNKFVKRLTEFKDLENEFNRMVINQPARTWKSYIAKLFISFLIWWHPWEDILYWSYSASAATKHIKWPDSIQQLLELDTFKYIFPKFRIEWYGWNWEIITTQEWFKQEQNWKIFPAAPWTTGTWFWFNWIFIDDPIKNESQASESSVYPELIIKWYNSVLLPRFHPTTVWGAGNFVVVIHTRWSVNDLTGSILKLQKKLIEIWEDNQTKLDNNEPVISNTKFLIYPAITTDKNWKEMSNFLIPDEYISQLAEWKEHKDEHWKITENIQPRDIHYWRSEKNSKLWEWLSEQSWQALYQQNPVEWVGWSFDIWQINYRTIKEMKERWKKVVWLVSVDPRYWTSSTADDTAIWLIWIDVETNEVNVLLTLWWINQPEVNYANIKKVIAIAETNDIYIKWILVEKNDRNEDQKQWYTDLSNYLMINNITQELIPIKPKVSKSMRIESIKGLFELWKMYFLSWKDDYMNNKEIKDWFGKMKKQLSIWQWQETNNQHDDYPDMLAQAVIWFIKNKTSIIWNNDVKRIREDIINRQFNSDYMWIIDTSQWQ